MGDISLNIFDDRLEIHNIGRLYGGLTIDQLSKTHPSRRRNEKIAQVFYVRELIDRWGSGTQRILEWCKQEGLPTPEFAETDGFVVRFFFKQSIAPAKIPNEIINDLNLREKEILEIITKAEEGISSKDILNKIANPPSSRTIQYDLTKLKSLNLINCKGKGRRTIWIIKR